jgi:hypothetical protein
MGKFVSVVLLTFFSLSAVAKGNYPLGPDPQMTPGSVCPRPNYYRYPEHVGYCNRNVDRGVKNQIIRMYEQKFGYDIKSRRGQFKIDHLIPLCAGGSNEMNNLWPQHKSVYDITDPMEPLICEKMAEGRLKQAKAIEMIHRAKNNLDQVPAVMAELNAL